MNEKSNPMPMMYKTIPAVAELNKVPGFDPLKFLRHKVSRKTNEEMLQLELPYQKLWFRLRHPQGRMKLTTLRITEQLAINEGQQQDSDEDEDHRTEIVGLAPLVVQHLPGFLKENRNHHLY